MPGKASPAPPCRQVFCLGWNEDGRKLATGSHDETIRTFSCDGSSNVRGVQWEWGGLELAVAARLRRPRARRRAAACAGTHACHLPLPVVQLRQETELRGHQEAVSRLAWHPTHPDRLASLGQMSESCVRWEAGREGRGLLVRALQMSLLHLRSFAALRVGGVVLRGGRRRASGRTPSEPCARARPLPRFWDTRSGKNTATLTTPGINLSMSWSRDAQYMAVVSCRARGWSGLDRPALDPAVRPGGTPPGPESVRAAWPWEGAARLPFVNARQQPLGLPCRTISMMCSPSWTCAG